MTIYQLGSKGDDVREIQRILKELDLYRGPLDGIFGGGTESAVKLFQQKNNLEADGSVGPITWRALFNHDIPSVPIAEDDNGGSIEYKCLALTGSFETGAAIPDCFAGISGDFDGQGMSFGVAQWNFGQDSLQPLFKEMIDIHPEIVKNIFQVNCDVFTQVINSSKDEQMAFIRSIQHPVKHTINEPWQGMFKSLGRTKEFQDIELQYANGLFNSALALCREYGLWSERAAALMFDIKVQNGGISDSVKKQMLLNFEQLPKDLSREDSEVQKMSIVANCRADAANPQWKEDVRARKLCIANGGGIVHGIRYDLERQFGIRLKEVEV